MSHIPTIVRYLAQGVKQEAIADIVGCTPGYVSQIKELSNYAELEAKAKLEIKASEEQKARELRYEHLEDAVLDHLEENMAFSEFSEATKLLEILNRRRQGAAPVAPIQNNTQINVVNLTMPTASVPELILNDNKEVIGIGDKSLTPMGAGGVRAMFIQLKQNKEARLAAAKEAEREKRIIDSHATVVSEEEM